MRRGDAFSKSNWGVVIFSVQIHGANIRKIGGREVGNRRHFSIHLLTLNLQERWIVST